MKPRPSRRASASRMRACSTGSSGGEKGSAETITRLSASPGMSTPCQKLARPSSTAAGVVRKRSSSWVRERPSPCTKKVSSGRASSSRGRNVASILRLVNSTRARPRLARSMRSMAAREASTQAGSPTPPPPARRSGRPGGTKSRPWASKSKGLSTCSAAATSGRVKPRRRPRPLKPRPSLRVALVSTTVSKPRRTCWWKKGRMSTGLDLKCTRFGPSRLRVETQPSGCAKICSIRPKAVPTRSARRSHTGFSGSAEASRRVSCSRGWPASTQPPTASARAFISGPGASKGSTPPSMGTQPSRSAQERSQGASATVRPAPAPLAASRRSVKSRFMARLDQASAQLSVSCSSRSWASSRISTGASGSTWPKADSRSTRSAMSRAWFTMMRSASATSWRSFVRWQLS